jgi:serine protease Do
MKKFIYQTLFLGAVCMVVTQMTIAQTVITPAPPDAKTVIINKGDQTEIVIRQKGGKDAKLTLEIKNGDFFINGKPLEKFDDENIVIEKRELGENDMELPLIAFAPSPFREHEMEDAARAYSDDAARRSEDLVRRSEEIARRNEDMQRKIEKSIKIKMNSAFLGVSSRKAEKGGATVLEVTKGSPAEKAGIKKGDIIIKVNETKIENPDNLYETIHNFKPGDKVKIVFTRDGKEQSVTATLEKADYKSREYFYGPDDFNYNYKFRMPPMPDMDMMPWGMRQPKLGIKAQDTEDGVGVSVLEVQDSTAAAKAGLKKGDIILQFNGAEVNSTNELLEQIQESRQKTTVKVKIKRGGVTQDIDVKFIRKLRTAEL